MRLDKIPQTLAELIQTNKLAEINNASDMQEVNITEMKLFSPICDELTVSETDGLILKSRVNCINKSLALAHKGHQGIVKPSSY